MLRRLFEELRLIRIYGILIHINPNRYIYVLSYKTYSI